jgi:hypothetical protein
VALQRIERAAHQRLDHEIVEARGHEHQAQIAREQLAFDDFRLIIRHSFLAFLRLGGLR